MSIGRWVLGFAALVMSGCAAPSLRSIDQKVSEFASQPFDVTPPGTAKARDSRPARETTAPASGGPSASAGPVAPDSRTHSEGVVRTSYTQVEGTASARVAPPLRIRRHPRHVAVGASAEKFQQARGGQRDGIGPGDSGDVKAQRLRRGDQFCLKRGEI